MGVFVLMFAALASAWNLVGGFAGYPSLGHAAFFGIGAYAVAILFQNPVLGTRLRAVPRLPPIGVGAAVIGIPIGWVSMRTRADVFAIVTITFLFVVQTLAFNLRGSPAARRAWPAGPALPSRPSSGPSTSRARPCSRWRWRHPGPLRTKFGLRLLAVRADEDKARGIGVRVNGVKVVAFSLSVGLTAMAGGVWAYYEGSSTRSSPSTR